MTTSWLDARSQTSLQRYARENGVSDDTGEVMYKLTEIGSLTSYDVFLVCRALKEAALSPTALSGMVNEIVEAWDE